MLQQISSGSVKIISLNRTELLTQLRHITRRIKTAHDNVQDIRVFGSVARGDYVGTSDVDILIILAEPTVENFIERPLTFYRYFTLAIGVDLLVYTAAELERGNAFLTQIYAESQSIF